MSTAERLLKQGRAEGWRKQFLYALSVRFGELPEAVVTRVNGARIEDIKAWMPAFARAASLDEVIVGR